MFQFKQFAVDQSGCAMKINTDGVLLGALVPANRPKSILDIGTGTGVIALMLAQRFADSKIDAMEIDEIAAATASRNFEASVFNDRLNSHHDSFEDFFNKHPQQTYDLIVSNPPFYIHSLKSPGRQRTVAKHTDEQFFETLTDHASKHLSKAGLLWLILPIPTAEAVQHITKGYGLHLHTQINISSYPHSEAHRHILAFSLSETPITVSDFVIYNSPKKYTAQYQEALKEFFIIF